MDGPRRVAILGLGLMGGSLARALRALADAPHVGAWTADGDDPGAALRDGIIDAAPPDAGSAVAGADLVVLAAPVGASSALLGSIAEALAADAVVTDVCSVKTPLVAAAARAGLSARFVGAHPLCGSHEGGWRAGRADLYRGARVHIVAALEERATRRVEALWTRLGALPSRIAADDHDRLMARVSHVPQLVSSALAAALAGAAVEGAELGPGGAGMTRLAASSTELWTDILLHNRSHVVQALAELEVRIRLAARALEGADAAALGALLDEGRRWMERSTS